MKMAPPFCFYSEAGSWSPIIFPEEAVHLDDFFFLFFFFQPSMKRKSLKVR
jgi:hypothetical protein